MAHPHGLIRPWLAHVDAEIARPVFVHRVFNESGCSPRFISKIIMTAGIAAIGLLQASRPMGIEAALHLGWKQLRRQGSLVLSLAFAVVAFSIFVRGLMVPLLRRKADGR